MAVAFGIYRQANGGGRAGTPNKATADGRERLTRIAMNDTNRADLRGRMFAELACYVAPKRKAIEHSAEPGTGMAFVMFGEVECASAEEWAAKCAPKPPAMG